MNSWFRRSMLVLGLLLALSAPSGAAPEPLQAALVVTPEQGLADSAAVQLLTVRLSQQPGLALLERAEVDRLLRERSLQLALAPEGLAARRGLGTLLKARLLLVLRPGPPAAGKPPRRSVELMIADTETGLRLFQERLPWDEKSPAALIDAALLDVGRAVKRLAEPVAAILAVPPFVSGDLERRYDSLQEIYARLVTEAVAEVPGLRLVELAEARALADELRLADPGAGVNRQLLPYYLQGRYRNEGRDGARKITLALELRCGERSVARWQGEPLSPDAAAAALSPALRQLLPPLLQGRKVEFNPEAELAELTRQARQFGQLGEWAKALTLTEAALLLKPGDLALHKQAVSLSVPLINEAAPAPDSIRRTLEIHRCALEHFEIYLRAEDFSFVPDDEAWKRGTHEFINAFLDAGLNLYRQAPADPALQAAISELGRTQREMLTSFFEFMADHPEPVHAFPWLFDLYHNEQPGRSIRTRIPIRETPAETAQALLRQARAIVRRSKGRDVNMIAALAQAKLGDPVAEKDYRAQIAALPGGQYAFLLQLLDLKKEPDLARRKAALAKLAAAAEAAPVEKGAKTSILGLVDAELREIEARMKATAGTKESGSDLLALIKTRNATPVPLPANSRPDYDFEPLPAVKKPLLGWIPAGAGIDLLWDKQTIYVMRRRGQITPLATFDPHQAAPRVTPLLTPAGEFTDVVFDGRRAWAPLPDQLLAIDPATGALETIGEKQGLPPGRIKVAPLAPGRVCAVGGFGRAWCAVVECAGPAGPARVDIFHEARLAMGAWTDPALAFIPRFAATLRGADGRPRVLVGRKIQGRGKYLPLLLDPERRRAEVVPQRISGRLGQEMVTAEGGELFWVASDYDVVEPGATGPMVLPGAACLRLERFAAPEGRMSVAFSKLPVSPLFLPGESTSASADAAQVGFLEGQCFLFMSDCWWLDRVQGRLVRLQGNMPLPHSGLCRLGRSGHYGLVMMAPDANRPGQCLCYAFRPRGDLARAFPPDAPSAIGGRQVVKRDPIDGRALVLRRYHGSRADAWTTLTEAASGDHVFLERDAVTTDTTLAIFGDDQTDPVFRQYYRYECRLDAFGDLYPAGTSSEDPLYVGLEYDPTSPVGPRVLTLADALGNPLAGAEVTAVVSNQPDLYHMSSRSPRFVLPLAITLPPRRADAQGRVELAQSCAIDTSIQTYRISHPDYGLSEYLPEWEPQRRPAMRTAPRLRNPLPGAGRLLAPAKATPPPRASAPSAEPERVLTPLVRRDSPEAARALRGRVVDAQGRPVAGARIRRYTTISFDAVIPSAELPGGRGIVRTGADGRFRFFLRKPAPGKHDIPPLLDEQHWSVIIDVPGRPDLPIYTGTLDGKSEHTITLAQGRSRHRFVFMDNRGTRLDPARFMPVISRILSTDVVRVTTRTVGLAGGVSMSARTSRSAETVYDGTTGTPLPDSFDLADGHYEVRTQPAMNVNPIDVTPQSPYELVFRVVPPLALPFFNSLPSDRLPANFPHPQRLAGSALTGAFHVCEGRVLDAATSRPLAGAWVAGMTRKPGAALASLTPEQWRALRQARAPYDLAHDPALAPLMAALGRVPLVRADAEGRFTLSLPPGEPVGAVLAFEENYIAAAARLDVQLLTRGRAAGPLLLPPLKLLPAARLRVKLVESDNSQPAYPRTRFMPSFALADLADKSWNLRYPGWLSNTPVFYLYGEDLDLLDEAQTIPVPAGIPFRLSFQVLRPRYPTLQLAIPGVLNLRQGETRDLGTLKPK